MTKRIVLTCVICLSVVSFNRGVTPANAQTPVSFSKDIQPILEQNCLGCHGPSMQSSRLNLSTLEDALHGGARGSAIVPGQAEDSRLYRMVAGLDKPAMPLGGTKLTDEQIAAIKNWINQGAHWDTGAVGAKTQPDSASSVRGSRKRSTPSRRPRLLGLQVAGPGAGSRCCARVLESHRSLSGKGPRGKGSEGGAEGRSAHLASPGVYGFDRSASVA